MKLCSTGLRPFEAAAKRQKEKYCLKAAREYWEWNNQITCVHINNLLKETEEDNERRNLARI